MAPGSGDAYDICLTTLRQTDFDRYLACLLIPEAKRGAVAALYAFNAELARIRDVIHQALPGEIRLQWWRDLLEGAGQGDAQANPLAAGLLRAIDEHHLPRAPLVAMTEARIFDLYDDPMGNTAMFEGYAGETASALIQLVALVLDAGQAPKASEAAGHAGIAQLVAGCLMLLPVHRQRHQVYVPGDILAATGLDANAFLKGGDSERIAAALSAFIGFGRDHLARARKAAGGGAINSVSGAFLPVSLAEPVFERTAKLGAAALSTPVQLSPLRRQWRLWRASRNRMF
jgi:phytoene synthase